MFVAATGSERGRAVQGPGAQRGAAIQRAVPAVRGAQPALHTAAQTGRQGGCSLYADH